MRRSSVAPRNRLHGSPSAGRNEFLNLKKRIRKNHDNCAFDVLLLKTCSCVSRDGHPPGRVTTRLVLGLSLQANHPAVRSILFWAWSYTTKKKYCACPSGGGNSRYAAGKRGKFFLEYERVSDSLGVSDQPVAHRRYPPILTAGFFALGGPSS